MDTSLHRKAVADRKVGSIPGFEWFRVECIGDDAIKFTGCVSSGVFTKGPRKGRLRYDGTPCSVVVMQSEEMAEYIRFEAETGKCGDCAGNGKVFARWDHVDGTSYLPCRKCCGSGLLESAQSAPAVVAEGELAKHELTTRDA